MCWVMDPPPGSDLKGVLERLNGEMAVRHVGLEYCQLLLNLILIISDSGNPNWHFILPQACRHLKDMKEKENIHPASIKMTQSTTPSQASNSRSPTVQVGAHT